MKMKKLLAGLLAAAMLLVNMPMKTNAEAMTAETLQAAIDAATTETTITLTNSIEVPAGQKIIIADGKTIVLDLAGYTISGTDNTSSNYELICNNGNLTINDSGSTGAISLKATVDSGWSRYSATVGNIQGTLTVNGGKIEHTGGTSMAYAIDNLTNTNGINDDAILTINNGNISSTYYGIRQSLISSAQTNKLTVNNGTIDRILIHSYDGNTHLSNTTITGGNISSIYAWYAGSTAEENLDNVQVNINGGTIGLTSSTLDVILNYGAENATFELANDIVLDEELYLNSTTETPFNNITIDGNGYTITASDEFTQNLEGQINLVKIENANNVTLKDIKLVTTEKNKHVLDVYGSTNVVLENVTLDHTKAVSGAPLIANQSTVTLTGTTKLITGENSWYAINVDDKGTGTTSSVNIASTSVTLEGPAAFAWTDNEGTVVGNVEVDSETGKITIKEPTVYVPVIVLPDVEAEGVDSGEEVDVDTTTTVKEVRDALGRKNILTTVEVGEADDELVEVTYEAGREYKNETIYVLQWDGEEFTLVDTVEADKRGDVVFTVEGDAEYILSTVLPEETEEPETPVVYGWVETEEGWKFYDYATGEQRFGWVADGKNWYFINKETGIMLENDWIAQDSTGAVWYYVGADGAMVRDVTVDGYYIDANGEWRA